MERNKRVGVHDAELSKKMLVMQDPLASNLPIKAMLLRRNWTAAILLGCALAIIVAALVTHLGSCAARHDWVFAVIGTLVSPIGVGHGIGIWLRAWR